MDCLRRQKKESIRPESDLEQQKHLINQPFQKLASSETAQDVAVGPDGSIWIVSITNAGARGNQIRKWNPSINDFGPSIGEGVKITVDKQGNPWIIDALEDVYAYNGASWTKVGGGSTDISASANGFVSVVKSSEEHSVWRNAEGISESWNLLAGTKAKRVANDPQGKPWVIGLDGAISRWTGTYWTSVTSAKANDIGIGADGTVWIVTNQSTGKGGYQVAIWNLAVEGEWEFIPEVGATNIAVAPNGDLIAVDDQFGIFRLKTPRILPPPKPTPTPKPDRFYIERLIQNFPLLVLIFVAGSAFGLFLWLALRPHPVYIPSSTNTDSPSSTNIDPPLSYDKNFQDIAVGPDGSIWIVRRFLVDGEQDGCRISRWNPIINDFEPSIGGGVRIAIDNKGNIWSTTIDGRVRAYDGSKWTQVGHSSTDIGTSANGLVFVVGGGNTIWGNSEGIIEHWFYLPGTTAKRVASDPHGNPWVVGLDDGTISRWNGASWISVPGAKAKDIGIGADGTVWIITDQPADEGGNQVAIWNSAEAKWKLIPEVGAAEISVAPNGNLVRLDNRGTIITFAKPAL